MHQYKHRHQLPNKIISNFVRMHVIPCENPVFGGLAITAPSTPSTTHARQTQKFLLVERVKKTTRPAPAPPREGTLRATASRFSCRIHSRHNTMPPCTTASRQGMETPPPARPHRKQAARRHQTYQHDGALVDAWRRGRPLRANPCPPGSAHRRTIRSAAPGPAAKQSGARTTAARGCAAMTVPTSERF